MPLTTSAGITTFAFSGDEVKDPTKISGAVVLSGEENVREEEEKTVHDESVGREI